MTEIAIKEKINQYVLGVVYTEKEKIKNNSLLFKEGYFDSMGFITLLTFLEEEFKVTVSDADLVEENFESINAIAYYILKKLN